MSCFVTRPPRPVPCTCAGSTPCSDAMRATTGETNLLPLPDGVSTCAGAAACVGCGASADVAELRADLDRLAFLDEDLDKRAGRGARHLGVDLVGGDLEQRLVGL